MDGTAALAFKFLGISKFSTVVGCRKISRVDQKMAAVVGHFVARTIFYIRTKKGLKVSAVADLEAILK